MTNKNSTKRALISSAIALLLCFSMLIGTTFAWFTDSVSSATNQIIAGNLDVEMYYQNSTTTDNWTKTGDDTWKKVTEKSNIFMAGALWEPGHTEVVNFKIVNEGSLDLKYQLGINVTNEVTSTNILSGELKLSDHIKFGIVDALTNNDRTTAVAEAEKADAKAINAGYADASSLKAGASKSFTMVVYMLETVGNEANAAKDAPVPQIDLGIKLNATQMTGEFDSFGNDYDDGLVADADYYAYNAAELAEAIANGGTVALMEDIDLSATTTYAVTASDPTLAIPTGKNVVIDLNGYTLAATSNQTGKNYNMIDVRGTLTVKNGTIVTKHSGENMGWNNSTNVFNVTADGVLNIEDVDAKNLGGSDMAFVAHLNNWGEVTLNVKNSNLFSTYTAVRVFNSGHDMNNVNITNSTLTGTSQSFWVHNYTVEDFGTQEKTEAQAKLLNFNFIVDEPVTGLEAKDDSNLVAEANNTFNGKIRYGFTNGEIYYTTNTITAVKDNAADLDTALKTGNDAYLTQDMNFNASETTANSGYGATGVTVAGSVLDGNGCKLGINNWDTWDAAVHTTGGTIKNITINSGMRGIFMGSAIADVYIDNVTIDGTIYTFNSDGGNKNYGVYISNSTLNGWTSHSDVHKEVVYTNCHFGEGQGYAFCRPYGPTSFVGCDFEAGYELDARGAVTFENCTIGGEPLTAENLATLVTSNIANATVK